MVSAGELLLLAGLVLAVPAKGGFSQTNHLVTAPQTTQFLEIGSNFKATCMIINTTEVTADDLYWKLSETTVSKELYTKLNESAISVTIPVTSGKSQWLFCRAKEEKSSYVYLNPGKFMYGVLLKKGYPPGKPENVSCVAVQEKTTISSTFSCQWATVGRQTSDVPTEYTLNVVVIHQNYSVSTEGTHAQVDLGDTYPHFMNLEVWVEAHNKLGKIESEHITQDANSFVKTNPPSDIKVISEKDFPTSPLMNWTQPIDKTYGKLKYEIRFCAIGSPNWTYVPKRDIAMDIQSFRLQSLQPYTEYITQVRCQLGDWSDWSDNTTTKTAEDRPTSKPDVWRTIAEVDGKNERRVQFVSMSDPPGKPENVSCVAVQEKTTISSTFSCQWATVGRQTSDVPTEYTLNVVVIHSQNYSVSTEGTHAQVDLGDTYPHFMNLEVWVEAHNKLGKIESEHITQDANSFVKTNPPSDIKVISEKDFPTSPLMNWTQPIDKTYGKLKYEIRFCAIGSPNWTYVPKSDIAMDIQSFRLQSLQPYTEYITQVRCQLGDWSDWSDNTTTKTAEDQKLAQAKEENLDMHQVLDQTLLELNNL
ncbi:interleukin-6 receptor subunit beta-like isoform X2 [Trematomus bernacchii]|uniref:interleukin-6 receptor subunit beta-like isoform X2 n=1 Tax=Trematomus bernacchii TaxID=40690 RepID=UPI00146E6434|nr:interleukin-6 receptor subunit beta-like isoform X2 [Trematomus bernacchii]